jgi:hypothetical protein
LKLVDDPVQLTVAVPSVNRAVVPEHNEAVTGPVGETASPDAAWAPRPSTAAAKPRVMRICVAFILRLLWGYIVIRPTMHEPDTNNLIIPTGLAPW